MKEKDINKNSKSLRVLIITPFFSPNVGGVETHFDDLTKFLIERNHKVFVVTYQPLTTRLKAPGLEKKGNLLIRGIQWFVHNWFPKLENRPFLVCLYLMPGLFIYSLIYALKYKVDVVHAQGLVPSLVGRILKLFVKSRYVASVHTLYSLNKKPLMGKVFAWVLNGYDKVLLVSRRALGELLPYGLEKKKTDIFTYWVNQEIFRPQDKDFCKTKVGWGGKFVVLFVGRLIEIKGAHIIIEAARRVNKNIFFAFIVTGSREDFLKIAGRVEDNMIYIGRVDYSVLNLYYTAADILTVPSQYEEGFARVNLEAMSCGTPIIASERGCLPDIIQPGTGELIDPPDVKNFAERFEYYYKHPQELKRMSSEASNYAKDNFGINNAYIIEKSYYTKELQ